ncbi:ABC transporter ATP-binding protein [Cesiribacter andamanensis]|uniref:Teichoic acids export ATP-binding protein TagH n=1 Tax=Cesiribacter andamanensis AMV16 TaxID=1279009 RepID=M7N0X3_9BACT|nr:ABC transporter ATP-binding protein [Cesiribacter andamanensis]EMR00856.1 Teichoic acids export ATP-binding protein TagH [Cesiribacter andamanensis AMV16]
MQDVVIQVENVSKLYRLGVIGTGSLRQDVQLFWNSTVLGKKDPFFTLGPESGVGYDSSKYLWALQNISFEVKKGEVWGIVGQNGAGKSTLLKILSRIVRPTHGVIRGKGKVSSLLEVGTGFHQELTGRENIYISGYILGMKKDEIRSKFDEIIDFSGIGKFIDTPVKRYSSGMYVRLAFAVAAHLEPDILIVDEVLAVGDAEFQKKCLGKMREVSQTDGRTILFVSHSMQAITNLCEKAIWLQGGKVKQIGPATSIVNSYVSNIQKFQMRQQWASPEEAPGNDTIRFHSVELVPELARPEDPIDIRTPLKVRFSFWNMGEKALLSTGLHLFSYGGDCIFDVPSAAIMCEPGLVEGECSIPGNLLNDGSYYISLIVVKDTSVNLFYFEECISFDVEDYRGDIKWFGKWMGAVRPKLPFSLKQNQNVLN